MSEVYTCKNATRSQKRFQITSARQNQTQLLSCCTIRLTSDKKDPTFPLSQVISPVKKILPVEECESVFTSEQLHHQDLDKKTISQGLTPGKAGVLGLLDKSDNDTAYSQDRKLSNDTIQEDLQCPGTVSQFDSDVIQDEILMDEISSQSRLPQPTRLDSGILAKESVVQRDLKVFATTGLEIELASSEAEDETLQGPTIVERVDDEISFKHPSDDEPENHSNLEPCTAKNAGISLEDEGSSGLSFSAAKNSLAKSENEKKDSSMSPTSVRKNIERVYESTKKETGEMLGVTTRIEILVEEPSGDQSVALDEPVCHRVTEPEAPRRINHNLLIEENHELQEFKQENISLKHTSTAPATTHNEGQVCHLDSNHIDDQSQVQIAANGTSETFELNSHSNESQASVDTTPTRRWALRHPKRKYFYLEEPRIERKKSPKVSPEKKKQSTIKRLLKPEFELCWSEDDFASTEVIISENISATKTFDDITQKVFDCQPCNFRPTSDFSLIEHILQTHGTKTVPEVTDTPFWMILETARDMKEICCSVCEEPIQNFEYLKKHFKDFHRCVNEKNIGRFRKKFYKSTSVQKRSTISLFCDSCEFKASTFLQLQKHIAKDHPNDGTFNSKKEINCNSGLSPKEVIKRLVCTNCGQHFSKLSELRIHIDSLHSIHHREEIPAKISKVFRDGPLENNLIMDEMKPPVLEPHKRFRCTKCDEKFDFLSQVQQHLNDIHSPSKSLSPESQILKRKKEKSFVCKHCRKKFCLGKNLRNHILVKHRNLIEKGITLLQDIPKLKTNSKVKREDSSSKFECSKCDRSYMRRHHLKRHMLQSHQTDLPALSRKQEHQYPEEILNGDLPGIISLLSQTENERFTCKSCNASFSVSNHLKYHILMQHLKFKRLDCSECDEKFAHQYLLDRHILTHRKLEEKFPTEA